MKLERPATRLTIVIGEADQHNHRSSCVHPSRMISVQLGEEGVDALSGVMRDEVHVVSYRGREPDTT